jgi:hypothetical protein
MSDILEDNVQILCDRLAPHLHRMLVQSRSGAGDLAVTEDAIGVALDLARSLLVGAALEASSQEAPAAWACPSCKKRLCRWAVGDKSIVTRHGEGLLKVSRYRCRTCRKDFYPLQTLNDLSKTQFTIGARELIAVEAAEAAFAPASVRLGRLGVPVSASEVERIADDVGRMRKEEEELVRIHLHVRKKDLPIALYPWSDWDRAVKTAKHAIMSVDGAKIRSEHVGPKGLDWFEVRSGILTLPGAAMPKAQVAGDISPDALFESMRSVWRQSLVCKIPLVFVADGAEWIWERVKLFFPKAVQVLDLFHAAQHVASAARAAWGEDADRTALWIDKAIAFLANEGPQWIVRQLLVPLGNGSAVDREELIRHIRYLYRHRHRMKYRRWKEQGITIGSGAMESRIKQVSSMRLRRPGMMWTKGGADLMLRLRASVLSDSLSLTTNRHRKICVNRMQEYRLAV